MTSDLHGGQFALCSDDIMLNAKPNRTPMYFNRPGKGSVASESKSLPQSVIDSTRRLTESCKSLYKLDHQQ